MRHNWIVQVKEAFRNVHPRRPSVKTASARPTPLPLGAPVLVEAISEPGGAVATGMTDPGTAYRLQPMLHDLVSTVLAPTTALGSPDGQIHPAGVQGLFHADSRALSQVKLEVDGREPEPVGYAPDGPGGARFVSLLRW